MDFISAVFYVTDVLQQRVVTMKSAAEWCCFVATDNKLWLNVFVMISEQPLDSTHFQHLELS